VKAETILKDSSRSQRAIVAAYPRTEHFKEDIIQTFYDGIMHKPETTFGNVKADVLADKDPKFRSTSGTGRWPGNANGYISPHVAFSNESPFPHCSGLRISQSIE
jgi:hypothetical protein